MHLQGKQRRRSKVKTSYTKYRPKIRIRRILWEFHASDDDPFPSIPHGHSIDPVVNLKLDPFTGNIYDVKRKKVAVADKKELDKLHKDSKFIELIAKSSEYHSTNGNFKKLLISNHNYFSVKLNRNTLKRTMQYKGSNVRKQLGIVRVQILVLWLK